MFGRPTPIEVGSTLDDPSCCDTPMSYVDNGIQECVTCECYLMTTNGVVDTLRKCPVHS